MRMRPYASLIAVLMLFVIVFFGAPQTGESPTQRPQSDFADVSVMNTASSVNKLAVLGASTTQPAGYGVSTSTVPRTQGNTSTTRTNISGTPSNSAAAQRKATESPPVARAQLVA